MKTRMLFISLIVALAASLAGGFTMAWFTAKSPVPAGKFTAGTVMIKAGETVVAGSGTQFTNWNPGQCVETELKVTNTGSKKIYLRARFEGFWTGLHHNTATVTAKNGQQTVSAVDRAYFTYGYNQAEPTKNTGTDNIVPGETEVSIKKWVSVDPDGTPDEERAWHDASNPHDAPYLPQQTRPRFRFTVTNNGSVPLTDVVVTDSAYGEIGTCPSLAPGEPCTFYHTGDIPPPLSPDNVRIRLLDGKINWEQISNHFYYKKENLPGETVTLHVEVCLDGPGTGNDYQGAVFTLFTYFEAVQSSNDAPWAVWGWRPGP